MAAKSRTPVVGTLLGVLAAVGLSSCAQQSFRSDHTGAEASLPLPLSPATDQALALWQAPVCPLVSGLPGEAGEFILERFSQVASSAGVPLGGEHCVANLYILVSRQPADLFKGMADRNPSFTFGFDQPQPATVDNFIATSRPVRVWYDTYPQTAWGQPVGRRSVYYSAAPYVVNTPPSELTLKSDVSHVLYRVFVLVDRDSLKGVSLGQLADYVAMAGLTHLASDTKRLGGVPTILKLFEKTPEAVPTGVTDWDRAVLKTLYGKRGSNLPAAAPNAEGGIASH